VKLLQSLGHDTSQLRSKAWTEFAQSGAPDLDFIITVCDNAAGEACPVWPGKPMTAHWGVPDPAAAEGTPAQIAAAFAESYRMLERRIGIFAALPIAALDRLTLETRLREIGRMSGATPHARAG
jgi:arsenate reductase